MGGIHGIYQILEMKISFRNKRSSISNIVLTFFLVSFAWIFFRAETITVALRFILQMFRWNPWVLSDGTLLSHGLDVPDWIVLTIALIIVIFIEITQIKGKSVYDMLMKRSIVERWIVYYLIIIVFCKPFLEKVAE